MQNAIDYIDWIDSPHWTSKTELGSSGEYFQFTCNWNSRDQSWSVSIATLDDEILIHNRKLILQVNLLEYCYSYNRPDCILMPLTNNPLINGIDKDHLTNGEVRLYHIPLNNPILYNTASNTSNSANVEYITLPNNLYTNTEGMNFMVGGLEEGTSFKDVEYSTLFDNLLYQNDQANFTSFFIDNIPNEIEVGGKVPADEYIASFSIDNTGLAKEGTLQLKHNDNYLKKYLPVKSPIKFILPEISSNEPIEHKFHISAFNRNGVSFGKFYNLNFMYRIYYGEYTEDIDDNNLDNPMSILRATALTNNLQDEYQFLKIDNSGSNYKWFCYPAALGQNYIFYDLGTDVAIVMNDPQDVIINNEHGLSIGYYCYRTFYEINEDITIGIKPKEQV